MGIFDGVMMLSDLDGTLLDHGELSEQHLEAVRYFVENGGAFCPATGRPEKFLFENFPRLPLKSYCIVKNGTAIYDCAAGKYIWYKALDSTVVERVIHLVRHFPAVKRVTVHTLDDSIVIENVDVMISHRLRSVTEEILKVVLWTQNAVEMRSYCEQFDDFQYVCSTDHLCEILPKQTGKGVCTDILRSRLSDIKCFVGVGDYDNDITLLEAVDIAVAVDGGYTLLKDYADWVAPPIKEHPIAWLVEKLEREIRAKNLR